ncbi:MAG: alpha/beta hydrolase [Planctomycetes bacterium]|nr:alpha/beta hydrolase [Planctomycetota bacterium]
MTNNSIVANFAQGRSAGAAEPLEVVPLALKGATSPLVVFRPAAASGPPVVLLHGIASHPGWFEASAGALAAAGHAVYSVTRRGSGTNVDARGHARSVGQLLDDLDRAVDAAVADSGRERVALAGISWGGKYAACWALDPRRAGRLAALALVAPGVVPRVTLPPDLRLAIAACAVVLPRQRFPIPLNDPALFTDTPERRQFIADDPHRLTAATARFLAVSRLMDRRLARAPAGAIETPTTLLLADRDRIIDNRATQTSLQRLTGGLLRTCTLAGAHTLEFEPDPTAYFAALVAAVQTP